MTHEPEREHADAQESFVVFLIGMRINRWWKVHRWLPVFLAMVPMRRELGRDDGLLGSRTTVGWRTVGLIQYWTGFESVRAYARDEDREHLPTWRRYYREWAGDAVGVWHETYRVRPGDYEAVYVDTQSLGLGAAVGTAPATGDKETAAGRTGGREEGSPVASGDEV